MALSWDEIERTDGFSGVRRLAEQDLPPLLDDIPIEPHDPKRGVEGLQLPFFLAFFGFVIAFSIVQAILPDNFFGIVLTFIAFPALFLGSIALMLYLYRGRILAFLMGGKTRFLARAEVMSKVADAVGLTYVPAPGGAPSSLKTFANWKRAPKEFKGIVETLDEHGGMEGPVEAVRKSGIMLDNVYVIAKEEDKAKYYQQTAEAHRVEDGFSGVRNGLTINMFEWIEAVDEGDDIYHLAIVMDAPTRLQGVTQMRSRKVSWPKDLSDAPMQPVDVPAKVFTDQFKIRSTDQVEARTIFNPAVLERVSELAHGDKIRAVAVGNNIIIDLEGHNRFEIVSIATGEWSADTVRQTFSDLVETLTLVDAVGHAFMVRRGD